MWTILSINLFCFILITFCYIGIFYRTKISSKRSGQQHNPNRLAEEDAIQKKITIIIATDFLCWVPFTVISALHNLEYIDASFWYASFTMTVLPLNSVINPLLYDKELAEMLLRNFGKLKLKIKVVLGNANLPAITGLFRSKTRTFFSSGDRDMNDREEQSPEMIPMDRLVNNEIAAEEKENADASDHDTEADGKIEEANGLDCNISVYNDENVEDEDRHVNVNDDKDANGVDHNIDGDETEDANDHDVNHHVGDDNDHDVDRYVGIDNDEDVKHVNHNIYSENNEDVDHNIDSEKNGDFNVVDRYMGVDDYEDDSAQL